MLWELAHGRADVEPLFRNWNGNACSVAALREILYRLARRAAVVLPRARCMRFGTTPLGSG